MWALSRPSQKRCSMVNFHSFCSCCWDANKTAVTGWETGRMCGEQQSLFLLGRKSSGYHASDTYMYDTHRKSIENCSVRSLLRRRVGGNGWEFKKRNSEQKMDLCLEERHETKSVSQRKLQGKKNLHRVLQVEAHESTSGTKAWIEKQW